MIKDNLTKISSSEVIIAPWVEKNAPNYLHCLNNWRMREKNAPGY